MITVINPRTEEFHLLFLSFCAEDDSDGASCSKYNPSEIAKSEFLMKHNWSNDSITQDCNRAKRCNDRSWRKSIYYQNRARGRCVQATKFPVSPMTMSTNPLHQRLLFKYRVPSISASGSSTSFELLDRLLPYSCRLFSFSEDCRFDLGRDDRVAIFR